MGRWRIVMTGCVGFAGMAHAAGLPAAGNGVGAAVIAIFLAGYLLVILEERLHLRKSIPVMLAASLIWSVIAFARPGADTEDAVRRFVLEYAELFLFLLAAMTYVNALTERGVFEAIRRWLGARGFSYRGLFWMTGIMAFFLSPVLDNLTTALVLAAVLLSAARDCPPLITLGCINIVVAANAGGAFSPFGDITTLMVWQSGKVPFQDFFHLFAPAVINFVVPAACMHFAVPCGKPAPSPGGPALRRGALVVILLFAITIATAVLFHNMLHLPPFLGMMSGLALLKTYGYYLNRSSARPLSGDDNPPELGEVESFDSFEFVARAEWDTLLFFFGVILCVGGLSQVGWLDMLSHELYGTWGATAANTAIGMLSAIVDNIPIMVAVIQMDPAMDTGQWLLVTLTAGVGGSLLSIGSAAGVALMGQAREHYTFLSHLRWSWAIALGYGLSILCHLWINSPLFTGITLPGR